MAWTSPVKALAYSLLEPHISPFLDGFSLAAFDFNVAAGTARLPSLQLRPDALAALNLPYAVSGVVEALTVSVPWTAQAVRQLLLGEDPERIVMGHVDVTIDGLTLTVSPQQPRHDGAVAAAVVSAPETMSAAAVRLHLRAAEREWRGRIAARLRDWGLHSSGAKGDSSGSGGGGGSGAAVSSSFDGASGGGSIGGGAQGGHGDLSTRLRVLFLRLIRVTLLRVHVRFMDELSNPQKPFILGASLASLTLSPCEGSCCKVADVSADSSAASGAIVTAAAAAVAAAAAFAPGVGATPSSYLPQGVAGGSQGEGESSAMTPSQGVNAAATVTAASASGASHTTAAVPRHSRIHLEHKLGTCEGFSIYLSSSAAVIRGAAHLPSAAVGGGVEAVPPEAFLLRGASARVRITQQVLPGRARPLFAAASAKAGAAAPPAMRIDAHLVTSTISISDAHLPALRGLLSFTSLLRRHARYAHAHRPAASGEALLSPSQSADLRALLQHRTFLAVASHAGLLPSSPITTHAASSSSTERSEGGSVDSDNSVLIGKGGSGEGDVAVAARLKTKASGGAADPYTLLSPSLRVRVRTRALQWWRFAGTCVLGDIRAGVAAASAASASAAAREAAGTLQSAALAGGGGRRSLIGRAWGEALNRAHRRKAYVTALKGAWPLLMGALVVPPLRLPGFCVLGGKAGGEGGEGLLLGSTNTLAAPRHDGDGDGVEEKAKSHPDETLGDGGAVTWLMDVASEEVPPHLTRVGGASAAQHLAESSEVAASSGGSMSSQLSVPAHITVKRTHASAAVALEAALDSMDWSALTEGLPSLPGEGKRHGHGSDEDELLMLTEGNLTAPSAVIASMPPQQQSAALTAAVRRVRRAEAGFSIEEVLAYRTIAEAELLAEHAAKLQAERQRVAFDFVTMQQQQQAGRAPTSASLRAAAVARGTRVAAALREAFTDASNETAATSKTAHSAVAAAFSLVLHASEASATTVNALHANERDLDASGLAWWCQQRPIALRAGIAPLLIQCAEAASPAADAAAAASTASAVPSSPPSKTASHRALGQALAALAEPSAAAAGGAAASTVPTDAPASPVHGDHAHSPEIADSPPPFALSAATPQPLPRSEKKKSLTGRFAAFFVRSTKKGSSAAAAASTISSTPMSRPPRDSSDAPPPQPGAGGARLLPRTASVGGGSAPLPPPVGPLFVVPRPTGLALLLAHCSGGDAAATQLLATSATTGGDAATSVAAAWTSVSLSSAPIALAYLQHWVSAELSSSVCASTPNLSPKWQAVRHRLAQFSTALQVAGGSGHDPLSAPFDRSLLAALVGSAYHEHREAELALPPGTYMPLQVNVALAAFQAHVCATSGSSDVPLVSSRALPPSRLLFTAACGGTVMRLTQRLGGFQGVELAIASLKLTEDSEDGASKAASTAPSSLTAIALSPQHLTLPRWDAQSMGVRMRGGGGGVAPALDLPTSALACPSLRALLMDVESLRGVCAYAASPAGRVGGSWGHWVEAWAAATAYASAPLSQRLHLLAIIHDTALAILTAPWVNKSVAVGQMQPQQSTAAATPTVPPLAPSQRPLPIRRATRNRLILTHARLDDVSRGLLTGAEAAPVSLLDEFVLELEEGLATGPLASFLAASWCEHHGCLRSVCTALLRDVDSCSLPKEKDAPSAAPKWALRLRAVSAPSPLALPPVTWTNVTPPQPVQQLPAGATSAASNAAAAAAAAASQPWWWRAPPTTAWLPPPRAFVAADGSMPSLSWSASSAVAAAAAAAIAAASPVVSTPPELSPHCGQLAMYLAGNSPPPPPHAHVLAQCPVESSLDGAVESLAALSENRNVMGGGSICSQFATSASAAVSAVMSARGKWALISASLTDPQVELCITKPSVSPLQSEEAPAAVAILALQPGTRVAGGAAAAASLAVEVAPDAAACRAYDEIAAGIVLARGFVVFRESVDGNSSSSRSTPSPLVFICPSTEARNAWLSVLNQALQRLRVTGCIGGSVSRSSSDQARRSAAGDATALHRRGTSKRRSSWLDATAAMDAASSSTHDTPQLSVSLALAPLEATITPTFVAMCGAAASSSGAHFFQTRRALEQASSSEGARLVQQLVSTYGLSRQRVAAAAVAALVAAPWPTPQFTDDVAHAVERIAASGAASLVAPDAAAPSAPLPSLLDDSGNGSSPVHRRALAPLLKLQVEGAGARVTLPFSMCAPSHALEYLPAPVAAAAAVFEVGPFRAANAPPLSRFIQRLGVTSLRSRYEGVVCDVSHVTACFVRGVGSDATAAAPWLIAKPLSLWQASSRLDAPSTLRGMAVKSLSLNFSLECAAPALALAHAWKKRDGNDGGGVDSSPTPVLRKSKDEAASPIEPASAAFLDVTQTSFTCSLPSDVTVRLLLSRLQARACLFAPRALAYTPASVACSVAEVALHTAPLSMATEGSDDDNEGVNARATPASPLFLLKSDGPGAAFSLLRRSPVTFALLDEDMRCVDTRLSIAQLHLTPHLSSLSATQHAFAEASAEFAHLQNVWKEDGDSSSQTKAPTSGVVAFAPPPFGDHISPPVGYVATGSASFPWAPSQRAADGHALPAAGVPASSGDFSVYDAHSRALHTARAALAGERSLAASVFLALPSSSSATLSATASAPAAIPDADAPVLTQERLTIESSTQPLPLNECVVASISTIVVNVWHATSSTMARGVRAHQHPSRLLLHAQVRGFQVRRLLSANTMAMGAAWDAMTLVGIDQRSGVVTPGGTQRRDGGDALSADATRSTIDGIAPWTTIAGGVLALRVGAGAAVQVKRLPDATSVADATTITSSASAPRFVDTTLSAVVSSVSLAVEPDPRGLPHWVCRRFYNSAAAAAGAKEDISGEWQWSPGAGTNAHLVQDVLVFLTVAANEPVGADAVAAAGVTPPHSPGGSGASSGSFSTGNEAITCLVSTIFTHESPGVAHAAFGGSGVPAHDTFLPLTIEQYSSSAALPYHGDDADQQESGPRALTHVSVGGVSITAEPLCLTTLMRWSDDAQHAMRLLQTTPVSSSSTAAATTLPRLGRAWTRLGLESGHIVTRICGLATGAASKQDAEAQTLSALRAAAAVAAVGVSAVPSTASVSTSRGRRGSVTTILAPSIPASMTMTESLTAPFLLPQLQCGVSVPHAAIIMGRVFIAVDTSGCLVGGGGAASTTVAPMHVHASSEAAAPPQSSAAVATAAAAFLGVRHRQAASAPSLNATAAAATAAAALSAASTSSTAGARHVTQHHTPVSSAMMHTATTMFFSAQHLSVYDDTPAHVSVLGGLSAVDVFDTVDAGVAAALGRSSGGATDPCHERAELGSARCVALWDLRRSLEARHAISAHAHGQCNALVDTQRPWRAIMLPSSSAVSEVTSTAAASLAAPPPVPAAASIRGPGGLLLDTGIANIPSAGGPLRPSLRSVARSVAARSVARSVGLSGGLRASTSLSAAMRFASIIKRTSSSGGMSVIERDGGGEEGMMGGGGGGGGASLAEAASAEAVLLFGGPVAWGVGPCPSFLLQYTPPRVILSSPWLTKLLLLLRPLQTPPSAHTQAQHGGAPPALPAIIPPITSSRAPRTIARSIAGSSVAPLRRLVTAALSSAEGGDTSTVRGPSAARHLRQVSSLDGGLTPAGGASTREGRGGGVLTRPHSAPLPMIVASYALPPVEMVVQGRGGEAAAAARAEASKASLRAFAAKVLEAEEGGVGAVPLPALNLPDPARAGLSRVVLRNATVVFCKTWSDELSKGIILQLRAVGISDPWSAALLPRAAAFDYSLAEVSSVRVLVPGTTRAPHPPPPTPTASTTSGLPPPPPPPPPPSHPSSLPPSPPEADALLVISIAAATVRNSLVLVDVPRVVAAANDSSFLSDGGDGDGGGAPSSLITVPVERYSLDATSIEAAVALPLALALQSGVSSHGGSSGSGSSGAAATPTAPPDPASSTHGMTLLSPTLSPVVDASEGDAYAAALAAAGAGAADVRAAGAFVATPLLLGESLMRSDRGGGHVDFPLGTSFRALAALVGTSDVTLAGNVIMGTAVSERLALAQNVRKRNALEPPCLVRLAPDVSAPTLTALRLASPTLRVQTHEDVTPGAVPALVRRPWPSAWGSASGKVGAVAVAVPGVGGEPSSLLGPSGASSGALPQTDAPSTFTTGSGAAGEAFALAALRPLLLAATDRALQQQGGQAPLLSEGRSSTAAVALLRRVTRQLHAGTLSASGVRALLPAGVGGVVNSSASSGSGAPLFSVSAQLRDAVEAIGPEEALRRAGAALAALGVGLEGGGGGSAAGDLLPVLALLVSMASEVFVRQRGVGGGERATRASDVAAVGVDERGEEGEDKSSSDVGAMEEREGGDDRSDAAQWLMREEALLRQRRRAGRAAQRPRMLVPQELRVWEGAVVHAATALLVLAVLCAAGLAVALAAAAVGKVE